MARPSNPSNCNISVLLADPDRLTAHLIADGLARGRHDISVVGITTNSAETIRELERSQPDVALINAHLEDGPLSGYLALQSLQPLCLKTAVVMMISESDQDLVVDAFRGGARGVFCRLQPVKMLPKCLRAVHKGQIWASNETLAFVLEFLTQLKPLRAIKSGGGMNRLTPREGDVVRLLAEGLSTREISQRLVLTEHTIRNYVCNIYDKLGVSSRVELALYAVAREDLRSPMSK